MNNQIKKNAICFDIDFENIKENTLTTKKTINEPKKVDAIPNFEDPNEANKEQKLYKCPHCSRTFKREAYAKHVPICERVFSDKNENEKNTNSKDKNNDNLNIPNNKAFKGIIGRPKWENQSSELRAIIQAKRAEKGKKLINLF